MNADDNLAAMRREATRLEREMDTLLDALARMRDVDGLVSREALEEELVPSGSATVPPFAIRG